MAWRMERFENYPGESPDNGNAYEKALRFLNERGLSPEKVQIVSWMNVLNLPVIVIFFMEEEPTGITE